MLHVRSRSLIGSALILCVFAVSACSGQKGKKMTLKKRGEGVAAASDDWSRDEQMFGKDEKGKVTCLQLPALLKKIESLGDDLIAIYVNNLEFVDETGATDQPAAGELNAQKAAYFFKGPAKEKLFEVGSGNSVRNSAQVGALLSVGAQENCAKVSFKGGANSPFTIDPALGSKRGLGMVNGEGERRVYALLNGNQILVSVSKVVNDVPTCGKLPRTRRALKSFIISRPSDHLQAGLSANFARFLDDSVYSFPELKNQLLQKEDKKDDKKKDKTVRTTVVSDRVKVSVGALSFLADTILRGQGKLKDNNCAP